MTTPETVRVLEHVSATVKSREEKGEDGWRISVDIPSFKSTFPTILNFVPTELAQKLVPNTAVNLVLSRDKLRDGKDGKPQSGKMKWHYWWRLDSLWDGKQAEPTPTTPSVAEQAQTAARASAPRQSWDDRTVDIEASWAIGQASEVSRFLARNTPPGEYDGADVLRWADWFLSIKRQLVGEMRGIPAQQPAPAAQETTPAPAATSGTLPVSVVELLNRGMKELLYRDRAEMFAVLNVQSATELAGPEKLAIAWRELVAAKKV